MIEKQITLQLIGFYLYQLDSKNRLAIPAKFRQQLISQKELILSQGLEGCLTLYPANSWRAVSTKIESLSIKNKMDQRAFKRMLYASASALKVDEEGRILMPNILVEYARIKKDVVIIGLGDQIEIWAKEKWYLYQKKQKNAFTKQASQLQI